VNANDRNPFERHGTLTRSTNGSPIDIETKGDSRDMKCRLSFLLALLVLGLSPILAQTIPPQGFVKMPDAVDCSLHNIMQGGGASTGGQFHPMSVGSLTCKASGGKAEQEVPLVSGDVNHGLLATKSFGDFFLDGGGFSLLLYIRAEQLPAFLHFLGVPTVSAPGEVAPPVDSGQAVSPAAALTSTHAPAPASAAFVPIPPDIDCSIQGLSLKETPNGWIAKTATGLSCSMHGRGPAGTKDVEFVSKKVASGGASTKDFGEIRFAIHGVPAGGGAKLPDGGRMVEVDYSLTPPEPGLVTLILNADYVNAFRSFFSAPTPFEASVASCSGQVAAARPPNAKFKKPETVWRIVNLSDCRVHYAQLIDLGIHGRAGLMMTFDGAVTLTPDPGPGEVAAHVTSIDVWKPPFLIPGTKSGLHGKFTGFAALLGSPNGTMQQEQPELQPGQGYGVVSFKDLRSKKKIAFSTFIADTVRSDEAVMPPFKD
jgi:hypothetical protein